MRAGFGLGIFGKKSATIKSEIKKIALILIIIFVLIALFFFKSKHSSQTINNNSNSETENSTKTSPVSKFEVKTILSSATRTIEGAVKNELIPISLSAIGTASGPVRTRFVADFPYNVFVSNQVQDQRSFSCGSWSKSAKDKYDYGCIRNEGQPEKTDWSVEKTGVSISNISKKLPEFVLGDISKTSNISDTGTSYPYPEGSISRQTIACN